MGFITPLRCRWGMVARRAESRAAGFKQIKQQQNQNDQSNSAYVHFPRPPPTVIASA
jgi:hypothetical protein